MTFTFGKDFRLHLFGESHGECVGVVVEGTPPGVLIEESQIQVELDKRRPGVGDLVTSRVERDRISIRSGVFRGKTTGAPILMEISNTDVDSSAYEELKHTPRPGHADYTARIKYDGNNDYRGGGFFSGRMTAAFVMAGALAKQVLRNSGIRCLAHSSQVGQVKVEKNVSVDDIEKNVYNNAVRSADPDVVSIMEEEVANAKNQDDSVGGIIECQILGVPIGLGEPLFDSVESVMGHAMFSIPGVKGVEFGAGFAGSSKRGSEINDPLSIVDGSVQWTKNDAGGILGGITTGAPIVFRVAIKPTASIAKEQQTVDLEKVEETSLHIRGRHDPCIVPRAVPVVENLAAAVILDLVLRARLVNTGTHP